MASTLRLDFLQGLPEYVGKDRFEIANHLAKHDGYIAIVQFESMGTYFGCCRTIEELEEVLGSPNCKMREVLYHVPGLKDALLPLEAKGILKYAVPSASASVKSPQSVPAPKPKAQSAIPPASPEEGKKPRRPIAGYILLVFGLLIALVTACLSAILLLAYLSDPELSAQMGSLRLVLLACGVPLFLVGALLATVGGIVIYRAHRAAKVVPPPAL